MPLLLPSRSDAPCCTIELSPGDRVNSSYLADSGPPRTSQRGLGRLIGDAAALRPRRAGDQP